MSGRLVVDEVSPSVDGGEFPAKSVVGEWLPISANVWREGHEALGATVEWTGPSGETSSVPMTPGDPGADRWHAVVVPGSPGTWTFRVVAWSDPWTTWRGGLLAKLGAGVPGLGNECEEGARILDRVAGGRPRGTDRDLLRYAAGQLRESRHDTRTRTRAALTERVNRLVRSDPPRDLVTPGRTYSVYAERPRAGFSSWYELFPRSTGGLDAAGRPLHGTMRTAATELPRIAAMGFDVVYLPPVHPIGRQRRKGRNNAPDCEPSDVGSPWAIGSEEGGHDALHPRLGTLEDFDFFVSEAARHGVEVALDLALQCAPDHPWVREHPEWFTVRPDGTVAHAENPPKKYEDIYPLNFDTAPEELTAEVLRVIRFWTGRGVRIFRVDNPHTKPPSFWHDLIARVRATDPDVFFLAEAFTRPAVLQGLAKRGFAQSYTYFTWRDTKEELTEYLTELVATADFLRPNFFTNTPDILPLSLQGGGPTTFAQRAALAATLSPSWGIYSGFELYENEVLRLGEEEYLDSEKYELKYRDFAAARTAGRSLEPWITRLNQVRAEHPALHRLRTLRFHPVDNDALLAYSKTDPATGDAVLCVVSLNPDGAEQGTVSLDLASLGLSVRALPTAHDAITGEITPLRPRLDVKINPEHAVARFITWRNP